MEWRVRFFTFATPRIVSFFFHLCAVFVPSVCLCRSLTCACFCRSRSSSVGRLVFIHAPLFLSFRFLIGCIPRHTVDVHVSQLVHPWSCVYHGMASFPMMLLPSTKFHPSSTTPPSHHLHVYYVYIVYVVASTTCDACGWVSDRKAPPPRSWRIVVNVPIVTPGPAVPFGSKSSSHVVRWSFWRCQMRAKDTSWT